MGKSNKYKWSGADNWREGPADGKSPPSDLFWDVVPRFIEDDENAKRFIRFLGKTWTQARSDVSMILAGKDAALTVTVAEVDLGNRSAPAIREGFLKAWVADAIFRLYQACETEADMPLTPNTATDLFQEIVCEPNTFPIEIGGKLETPAKPWRAVRTAVMDTFYNMLRQDKEKNSSGGGAGKKKNKQKPTPNANAWKNQSDKGKGKGMESESEKSWKNDSYSDYGDSSYGYKSYGYDYEDYGYGNKSSESNKDYDDRWQTGYGSSSGSWQDDSKWSSRGGDSQRYNYSSPDWSDRQAAASPGPDRSRSPRGHPRQQTRPVSPPMRRSRSPRQFRRDCSRSLQRRGRSRGEVDDQLKNVRGRSDSCESYSESYSPERRDDLRNVSGSRHVGKLSTPPGNWHVGSSPGRSNRSNRSNRSHRSNSGERSRMSGVSHRSHISPRRHRSPESRASSRGRSKGTGIHTQPSQIVGLERRQEIKHEVLHPETRVPSMKPPARPVPTSSHRLEPRPKVLHARETVKTEMMEKKKQEMMKRRKYGDAEQNRRADVSGHHEVEEELHDAEVLQQELAKHFGTLGTDADFLGRDIDESHRCASSRLNACLSNSMSKDLVRLSGHGMDGYYCGKCASIVRMGWAFQSTPVRL